MLNNSFIKAYLFIQNSIAVYTLEEMVHAIALYMDFLL
jgi:hypothetical protein